MWLNFLLEVQSLPMESKFHSVICIAYLWLMEAYRWNQRTICHTTKTILGNLVVIRWIVCLLYLLKWQTLFFWRFISILFQIPRALFLEKRFYVKVIPTMWYHYSKNYSPVFRRLLPPKLYLKMEVFTKVLCWYPS